jgi:two-component system, sensor histidine kinase PdtaS
MLPASVASPLALVLTELLQNALQHGLAQSEQAAAGYLEVAAKREPDRLTVTVTDNGRGLPADFDMESTASLGLQIVRTLVQTELAGRLEISPRDGGGTRVLVVLPLPEPSFSAAQ